MFRKTTIKNNPKTHSHLTGDWLWEKAAMCAYIYGEFELPPFISDFTLFNTFQPGPSDRGYYGVCFVDVYKEEGKKQVDIIFAHRGTILNFDNIVDDLRIAMGYAPEMYSVALKYVANTINLLAEKHGARSIRLIENTGHSLGGVIADLVTLKLRATMAPSYDLFSTTFENPGSLLATQQLIKKGELPAKILKFAKEYCWNFANDIHLINCCQEQVGINNKILPQTYQYLFNHYLPDIPDNASCLLNTHYLFSYVADQHRIIKIYEAMKDEAEWEEDISYPVGLKNSYLAYLDYNTRQHYWDEYMKVVWDTHAKYKDKFKGIYSHYVKFFIDTLDNLRQEAEPLAYLDAKPSVSPLTTFSLFTHEDKTKDSDIKQYAYPKRQ